MKNLFLAFIFSFFILTQSIFSCTLGVTGLSEFDTEEYIFIGEVVGYTQPLESKKINKKAYGLIVKVKDTVYLPKTPAENFEVFPFSLWADCSYSGQSEEYLKDSFPKGSEIRVIAKDAKYLTQPTLSGNIRLEEIPGNRGSLTLNTDETGNRLTDSTSIFNYQNFVEPNFDNYGEKKASQYLALAELPDFEVRKDLLRLTNSTTQAGKNKILNRLLFAFKIRQVNLSAAEFFKTYTSDETEFERYFEAYLKMILSEEDFRQRIMFRNSEKELLKLGFQKETIEWAVSRAMYFEKIESPKEKVVQRSLEVVKMYEKAFSKLLDYGFEKERITKTLDSIFWDIKELSVQNLYEISRKKIEREIHHNKINSEVIDELKNRGYDESTVEVILMRVYPKVKELSKQIILEKSLEILSVYDYVSAELIKRGYEKSTFKTHLESALLSVGDISNETLLKRVLEIIPRKKND